MNRRRWILGAFAVLAWPSLVPAKAGILDDFFCSVARDTKRRNAWPEPFNHADRESYQQCREIMICNAWERQNQLSDFHFDATGIQLNEAGRLRISWILREAPAEHRTIFVHTTLDPQLNTQRVQTVQQYMESISFGANIPVIPTNRTDDGFFAEEIDSVSKRAAAATTAPKLK